MCRKKRQRQKYRSWDVDDVWEMESNRRYQAWADRQAKAAEQAVSDGGAEAAAISAQQVRNCLSVISCRPPIEACQFWHLRPFSTARLLQSKIMA